MLEIRIPQAGGGRAVHEHVHVDGIADDDIAIQHAQAFGRHSQRHVLHLGQGEGIGALVGFGHQHGVGMVVGALPVVIATDGGAAQHHGIAGGPLGIVKSGRHEGAGAVGGFHLHVLDQAVHPVHQILIEDLAGGAVIALVMEPGGHAALGQLAHIGMMAQIVVDGGGDDEHIAHHAIFIGGAGAAGAKDISVRKIKALVQQHGGQAQGRVDLAHAGHIQRHAVLDVQLVIGKTALDFIFIAALAVAFIIILRLAGEVASHFARFKLGQDQHLDLNRLSGLGKGGKHGAHQQKNHQEQRKRLFHKNLLSSSVA